jgi:hypothetical protein
MPQLQILWILENSLWVLNLLGSALVIWRLYFVGLQKTYRLFFAYMVVALVRSLILFPFNPRSETYFQVWVVTRPLLWLFFILVVSELYSLVLRDYRGIYSVSRWFFYGAATFSALISASTVFVTMAAGSTSRPPLLYYSALIERGIVTSLAIFLLLLLALVAWFAVPLSRNLLTHCCVYSALFLSTNAIMLYWHTGSKNAAYWGSVWRLSSALICYCCWVFLLTRRGEERTASFGLGRSPLEEKRLLGHLEAINATLLGTARK